MNSMAGMFAEAALGVVIFAFFIIIVSLYSGHK